MPDTRNRLNSAGPGQIALFPAVPDLLITACWVVYFIIPEQRVWTGAVVLLLTVLTGAIHARPTMLWGLFSALVIGLPVLHTGLTAWPWYLLVPIAVYLTVIGAMPTFRGEFSILRPGRVDRPAALLIGLTIVLAAAGLLLWTLLANPDLDRFKQMVPDMPLWMLPLAGLGFAVLNAAIEEITFRGSMQLALERALGFGAAPVVIQAALFGLLHFREGFPGGYWGVGMTFAYGLVLGVIRRRTQGLLAPWLAHGGGDIVVFTLVMSFSNTLS